MKTFRAYSYFEETCQQDRPHLPNRFPAADARGLHSSTPARKPDEENRPSSSDRNNQRQPCLRAGTGRWRLPPVLLKEEIRCRECEEGAISNQPKESRP
ncbi:hypothetical protein MTO96_029555 [Rhipicephalus appendiculatus]